MRGEDLEATVAVWKAANAARGQSPTVQRVTRVREKLTQPGASAYVAERQGVIGMILAEPGSANAGRGPVTAGLLHVSMVFVHPGSQRQGVGCALLQRVFAGASEAGIALVSLWTDTANEPAKRLYESVGMAPTDLRHVGGDRLWVRYERKL